MSYFIYEGPDLNLLRKPATLPNCSPRRYRFSYQLKVLQDKFALNHQVTVRTINHPNLVDLQEWAIDEAFRLVDMSQAYQLEIWYERRTQRLFLQFLLAD